ncbi:MAG TPA: hypothetical protein VFO19_12630 [Vicinamibacterales bacterium]|nr:hypothetical protein [Vicinamibacterales bacterium]
MATMTWWVLALTIALQAQAGGPAGALSVMEGKWTGKGTVNAQEVAADLEVGPALGQQFSRLQYRFTPVGTRGTFEGVAYYKGCKAATSCSGRWLDSSGAMHVLSAVQTADVLTSEWGDGATPRGKTEYRLNGEGGLVVTDWVRATDGSWRQFGLVTYARVR